MKHLLKSAPFKFFLALIASLALLATVAFGLTTLVLEGEGVFEEDYVTPQERSMKYRAEDSLYSAIIRYLDGAVTEPVLQDFVYSIRLKNGTEPLRDTGIKNATSTFVCYFVLEHGASDSTRGVFLSEEELRYESSRYPEDVYDRYRLEGGFLSSSQTVKSIEAAKAQIERLRPWRTPLPILTGVSLILAAVSLVLLCCSAGRKKNIEEIFLNAADRIPLDLVLAALTGIGLGATALLYQVGRMFENFQALAPIVFTGLICETASLLLCWLLYTVAARIKGKTLLKNTVLYRILSRIICLCKTLLKGILELIRKLPVIPGVAAVMGFLAVCNIILGLLSRDGGVFVLLVLEWIALFVCGILIALGFSYLQKKTKAMARGNLWERVEDKYLIGPLKEQAEDLNRIGEGLNAAVNERIKSERMKTELITNVSHDIKTPLTSIINYTDLLSKEQNLSETSAEYLKVLQRQSARLKKLTDDIVEASKASSGVLSVNFAPCDLKVLLEQTVGEYEEKTAKADLTVLLTAPERPVTISADGRRLWRIFENLMNNICKYALPSTRVYLTLTSEADQAVITFRNISKDPLNIDPDELTERFVRGDQSRNTEGSGLGLAIARSLTELQKGTFRIQIDGDLFKVTLTFPLQKQDKPSEE